MSDSRSQSDYQQDLVDSLLQSLHESSADQAQSLVSSALHSLDGQAASPVPVAADSGSRLRNHWASRVMVIALASAAVVLLVLSPTLFHRTAGATDAVHRCLDQTMMDVGRHYRVESRIRLDDDTQVIRTSDLYVKGGRRFAWRVLRLDRFSSKRELWLGSNNGQAWVVPPVGPMIEGEDRSLNEWVTDQDRFASPYLHVTTILRRMQDSYHLQLVPWNPVDASSELANCQHVTGTLDGPRVNLAPSQVDLWTDVDTGVAKKVITRWGLSEGKAGWESISITLIGDADLPDDFFTAEAHGGMDRRRIRFGSGENL